MTIGFYGAGKAGISLFLFFKAKGLNVQGIYSRRKDAVREELSKLNVPLLSWDELLKLDVIILTVEDTSIAKEADKLIKAKVNSILAHVSGAYASSIIKKEGRFSMHPAMSLPNPKRAIEALEKAIFCIEGDEKGIKVAEEIIKALRVKYIKILEEDKILYHAGCVLASNYIVTLTKLAKDVLVIAGFDEEKAKEIVLTLSEGTIKNIKSSNFNLALTGPIKRGDIETVNLHLRKLKEKSPNLEILYRILGIFTAELAGNKELFSDLLKAQDIPKLL